MKIFWLRSYCCSSTALPAGMVTENVPGPELPLVVPLVVPPSDNVTVIS